MSGYSNNTHDYVYFNNNKKKIFIKARELNKKKITKNLITSTYSESDTENTSVLPDPTVDCKYYKNNSSKNFIYDRLKNFINDLNYTNSSSSSDKTNSESSHILKSESLASKSNLVEQNKSCESDHTSQINKLLDNKNNHSYNYDSDVDSQSTNTSDENSKCNHISDKDSHVTNDNDKDSYITHSNGHISNILNHNSQNTHNKSSDTKNKIVSISSSFETNSKTSENKSKKTSEFNTNYEILSDQLKNTELYNTIETKIDTDTIGSTSYKSTIVDKNCTYNSKIFQKLNDIKSRYKINNLNSVDNKDCKNLGSSTLDSNINSTLKNSSSEALKSIDSNVTSDTENNNTLNKIFECDILNNSILLKANEYIQNPHRFMLNIFLDTKNGQTSILDNQLPLNIIPINVPLYFKQKEENCYWDLFSEPLVDVNTELIFNNIYEKLEGIYLNTFNSNNGRIDITKFLELLIVKYFYITYYQPKYKMDHTRYNLQKLLNFNDFLSKINIGFMGCKKFNKNMTFKYALRFENLSSLQSEEQSLHGSYYFSITLSKLRSDLNTFIERPINEKVPVYAVRLYTQNDALKKFYAFCAKLDIDPNNQYNIYLDRSITEDYYDVFFKVIESINKTFYKLGYMEQQFKLITQKMDEFPKDYFPTNIQYSSITFDDIPDYLGISRTIIDPRTGETIWFRAHISSPNLLFEGLCSFYTLTDTSLITNKSLISTEFSNTCALSELITKISNEQNSWQNNCKYCYKIHFVDNIVKMLYAYKFPKEKLIQIIKIFLNDIVIHELGHCFGLRHCMNRSLYTTIAKLADSIMDYYTHYAIDPDYLNDIIIEAKHDFCPSDEFVLEYIYAIIPDEKKGEKNSRLDKLVENNLMLLSDEVSGLELTTALFDISNNPERSFNELYRVINSIKANLADIFNKKIIDVKKYTKLLLSSMQSITTSYSSYIVGYFRYTRIDKDNKMLSFDMDHISTTVAMFLVFTYFENFLPLNNNEKKSLMMDYNSSVEPAFPNDNIPNQYYTFDRTIANIYKFMNSEYIQLYFNIFNGIPSLYLSYLANSDIIFNNMKPEDLVISMYDQILFGPANHDNNYELQPFYDIFLMEKFLQTENKELLISLSNYYEKIYNGGEFVKFVLWRNTVLCALELATNSEIFSLCTFIFNYLIDVFNKISKIINAFSQHNNGKTLSNTIKIKAVLLDLKKILNSTGATFSAKVSTISYSIVGISSSFSSVSSVSHNPLKDTNFIETLSLNNISNINNEDNEFINKTNEYIEKFSFFKFNK